MMPSLRHGNQYVSHQTGQGTGNTGHARYQRTDTPRYSQAMLQLAERAGIALPEALRARMEGLQRVPIHWQDELWEALCEASGDPLVGLQLGLQIQVGHLDSLGMLLVTCDTLG